MGYGGSITGRIGSSGLGRYSGGLGLGSIYSTGVFSCIWVSYAAFGASRTCARSFGITYVSTCRGRSATRTTSTTNTSSTTTRSIVASCSTSNTVGISITIGTAVTITITISCSTTTLVFRNTTRARVRRLAFVYIQFSKNTRFFRRYIGQ